MQSVADDATAKRSQRSVPSPALPAKAVEIWEDDDIAKHSAETDMLSIGQAEAAAEAGSTQADSLASDMYLPSYSLNDLLSCVPQMTSATAGLSQGASHPGASASLSRKLGVKLLGMRCAMAPSVSSLQRKMVVSDGSTICIKEIDGK
jgi:hypothetical protein